MRPSTAAAVLALPLVVVSLVRCADSRAPTAAAAPDRPSADLIAGGAVGAESATRSGSLRLPINESISSSGVAFAITQTGSGSAGEFSNSSTTSQQPALKVKNWGAMPAGWFEKPYGATADFPALVSLNYTTRGAAGNFGISNNASTWSALEAATIGTGWAGYFLGTAKGVYVETDPGGAGLQVVGGTKNAVVRTPGGAKALYTEESTEVWFTDYGFSRLTSGRTRVVLDPTFAQTINPGEPYHVFVQAYGDAELYVAERTPLGFVVALRAGDPGAEFSYRIVAKRKGFERRRLEPAPWADRAPEVAPRKQ